jgi:hypothetical protein
MCIWLQDSVFQLMQNKRWREGGGLEEFEEKCNGRWGGTRPWAASQEDMMKMGGTLHTLSKALPKSTHGNTVKNLFKRAKGSKTHDYFVLASSIGACHMPFFCLFFSEVPCFALPCFVS